MSLKSRETRKEINLGDIIKMKSFCTTKETVNKTKRQPTEWEKIFASDSTDKGLVSKIYKEFLKPSPRKRNNPVKKWAEDMNMNMN